MSRGMGMQVSAAVLDRRWGVHGLGRLHVLGIRRELRRSVFFSGIALSYEVVIEQKG